MNSVSSPKFLPTQTGQGPPQAQAAKRSAAQVPPQLREAAEGMEAMFLDYMMKVMRETVPKNEMDLENPATQIYRGMLDSETSRIAARTGGVGLSEQIIASLMRDRYNSQVGHGVPVSVQGGTDEGQPVAK